MGQGMIHIGQSQEITCVSLLLSSPSGAIQTADSILPATSTYNNVWQYLWNIPSQGRSLKPWCLGFFFF